VGNSQTPCKQLKGLPCRFPLGLFPQLPVNKKELHAKLDALLGADFLSLAALINQLHYEAFFRKNLPDGHLEQRLKVHTDNEFEKAMRAPTMEEFDEITTNMRAIRSDRRRPVGVEGLSIVV